MRAGAAAGPGRSSPDAHREVCDGLTPINLASSARENTFARYRTRCPDKGSSAATRPVRASPRTAAFLVGAFFAGALTATFFDALLATPVLFVAISPPYPIFFVGNNVTSTTGPRCRSPADHAVLSYRKMETNPRHGAVLVDTPVIGQVRRVDRARQVDRVDRRGHLPRRRHPRRRGLRVHRHRRGPPPRRTRHLPDRLGR
jgi:hypothetical protein